jgi:ribosomal protein S18 acetylase RimI-like enzyme
VAAHRAGRSDSVALVEIVDLDPGHHDAALALWQEAGLTRPWNDPRADLLRALEGPASTVLAALDGDLLVGTAMVGHDGHRGWVYYLAVRAADRRRGIGRALMAACEDWVQSRGVPKIQLMVRAGNAEAVGFYAALGYEDGDVLVLGRRFAEPPTGRSGISE